MLEIELPEFPHAVIYQQAAVPSGPGPSPLTPLQSRVAAPGDRDTPSGSLTILQVAQLPQCLLAQML